MKDILGTLAELKRPGLLIRAARLGTDGYRRESHLRRVLGLGAPLRNGAALMALVDLEADLDAQRRSDAAGYSVTRHVDVMIALMAEAQLLRASRARSREAAEAAP